jgi:predicted transporter
MASEPSRNAGTAGVLSAFLPGLGQFYNRQWTKGALFLSIFLVLAGILLSSTEELQQAVVAGTPPENLSQLFFLTLLLLLLAVLSIVDAARNAKLM